MFTRLVLAVSTAAILACTPLATFAAMQVYINIGSIQPAGGSSEPGDAFVPDLTPKPKPSGGVIDLDPPKKPQIIPSEPIEAGNFPIFDDGVGGDEPGGLTPNNPVVTPQLAVSGKTMDRSGEPPPELACRFKATHGRLMVQITNTGGAIAGPDRLEIDASGDRLADMAIRLGDAGFPGRSRLAYPVKVELDPGKCRVWLASAR